MTRRSPTPRDGNRGGMQNPPIWPGPFLPRPPLSCHGTVHRTFPNGQLPESQTILEMPRTNKDYREREPTFFSSSLLSRQRSLLSRDQPADPPHRHLMESSDPGLGL